MLVVEGFQKSAGIPLGISKIFESLIDTALIAASIAQFRYKIPYVHQFERLAVHQ
jgi:hypothetical protein